MAITWGEKNRFAKQAIWERDTKVPMIIAGPGVEGGKRCARPVGLIDLYPTLLSMCGLPANPQNEGRDLSPLLEDPHRQWNHPAITSYGPVNHTVRSDRYRYIRYEGGAEEFYDLENDPNEWTNLADDPDYADEIAAHRKHLPKNPARWRRSRGMGSMCISRSGWRSGGREAEVRRQKAEVGGEWQSDKVAEWQSGRVAE